MAILLPDSYMKGQMSLYYLQMVQRGNVWYEWSRDMWPEILDLVSDSVAVHSRYLSDQEVSFRACRRENWPSKKRLQGSMARDGTAQPYFLSRLKCCYGDCYLPFSYISVSSKSFTRHYQYPNHMHIPPKYVSQNDTVCKLKYLTISYHFSHLDDVMKTSYIVSDKPLFAMIFMKTHLQC